MRRLVALASLFLASLPVACGPSAPAQSRGDLEFLVSVRQAVTAPAVAEVWIHLTGTTAKGAVYDAWAQAKPGTLGYQVAITNIPAGSYQVSGKAFAAAKVKPQTTAGDFESVVAVPVTVASKSAQTVTLVLQQNVALWPPTTFTDAAPVIDSLLASTQTLDSGDAAASLSLAASASDRDGLADLASFAWSATYAPPLGAGVSPGVFSTPAALATTWRPPAGYEGDVTFVFGATDRKGLRASLAIAVNVSPRNGFGSLVVIVGLNNFPDVNRIAASNAQLAPGAHAQVSVDAADADGDPLSYRWSDGCGGAFADPSAATTDWQAPPAAASCALTVAVEDLTRAVPPAARGGRNVATLTVSVRDVVPAFGPTFGTAVQTPSGSLPPGTRVVFLVDVFEPTLDPAVTLPVAALDWSDGQGGPFTPLVAGLPTMVEWTVPACAALAPPYVVEVTATATGSASQAAFPFPVAVSCP